MSDSMIKIPGYKIPGYKIEREIGRGGMATVYLALQESLNRKVALKVMSPALGADEDFKTRFLNEGHIVGQLNHSNIVTVFDIGTHDNHYYLSMEYLPGGSLRERIQAQLPVEESLQIARTLGKALHYAHQRYFVHRDIKPLNVLFREDESPVLTDFGIAKALGSSSQLTRTGFAFGSVGYMSPEQALGKPIDHRSDIYSFGAMLWEMLTGQKLYQSSDAFSLALKHATAPIPQLPEGLQHLQPLLERLLAKQADDRFADMGAFVNELDQYLQGSGGHVIQSPLNPDQERAQSTSSEDGDQATVIQSTGKLEPAEKPETVTHIKQPAKSSKAPLALAAVLALGVIVGGAGWWWLTTSAVIPPNDNDLAIAEADDARQPEAEPAVTQLTEPSAPTASVEPGPVTQAAPEPPSDTRELSIAELLTQGEQHWQAGRYFQPAGNNAFETYRRISDQAPGNVQARDRLLALGRIRVAERFLGEAEALLEDGDRAASLNAINRGLQLAPEHTGLLELHRHVQAQGYNQ